MIKSPTDLKTYQPVTLDNGLRVLLVHNSESQKSAAALAVNVGHFNDPKDRQGMAHFLEHMLFLGTKKYPDGSEYQKFISQHGGSNNAWTATEHTCFFFDIQQQYFSRALKRFSQFFIAPLLSEEFINKERQNIDAEFKLKLKDDIRRLYDVHKETINQAHPFSQFSVGNIDTLDNRNGKSIRDELSQFYYQYYRADYMTLVLEGPQNLDELSHLADKLFSDIPAAEKKLEKINVPLYLPKDQGILIQVCPMKDDKQLIISFAMPSIDQYYRHKPESILSYLIGHEGSGSILSLLKKKQWAMGLTAGAGINGSNFKDFNISIALTDQGEKHIDQIIKIVFSYLSLLKSKPLPIYYYSEKQAIAELSFIYHEKSRPLDSASQLVINMQHYPAEDYIFGDYIMTGMCHDTINTLMNYFSTDNLRIVHISQQNDFSKVSHWYQVPYHIEKISEEEITHWNTPTIIKELYLPSANPYIIGNPTIFSKNTLSLDENKNPKQLVKSDGLTVWFKQDTIFKVPKGYIYIGIDTPHSIASKENIAMTRLLVDLYSDILIEENYDAELAGIHYHLYAHQGGITLQLSGVSEKQPQLLTKLISSLKEHKVQQDHFELLKQQMITHWKNADKSKSISQLFSTLSSMMQPFTPNAEDLWQALATVSFEQFVMFSQQLFRHVKIDVLIHGNWLEEHALTMGNMIEQTFIDRFAEKHAIKYPILDLNNQGELIVPVNLAEHDHATVIYYPLADKSFMVIARAMITSHLLAPLFFQEIRTEKQYGYLVGVGYIPINRYPGIAFYIQSPHTSPEALIIAIDEFISNAISMLSQMTSDDWEQLQQGLCGQLQEKDTSLRIKSQRFWSAICNNDKEYNHKEKLVNAILTTKIDDIKLFISKVLINTSQPDRVILISNTVNSIDYVNNSSVNIINDINTYSDNCQRKY